MKTKEQHEALVVKVAAMLFSLSSLMLAGGQGLSVPEKQKLLTKGVKETLLEMAEIMIKTVEDG